MQETTERIRGEADQLKQAKADLESRLAAANSERADVESSFQARVRELEQQTSTLEQDLGELQITNTAALAELTTSLDTASIEAVRQRTAADEVRRQYELLNGQVTAIEPYRLAFVDKARALLDGQTGVTVAENKVILETDDLYVGRATLRLTNNGRVRLQAVAQALATVAEQMPAELPWVLRVEGHTDNTPLKSRSVFDTNRALSAARAAAAAEQLSQQGVPGERVSAVGMSHYRPLVTEQVPDANRRNRRLEITLMAQR
jgi:chemotaxis protein MotB